MEPKIKKITTKKGTVFNSLQDYRQAAAKIGQPIDDMSDSDIINQFGSGSDPAIKIEYESTQQPPSEQKVESKGAQELVAPLAEVAKKPGGLISGAISTAGKSLFDTLVGFAEGMVTGLPAQIARAVGADPSKIKFQPAPGVPVPQYAVGGTLTSPDLPTLTEVERAPIKPLVEGVKIAYSPGLISSPYGPMAQPVRTQEEIRQLVESAPGFTPRELGKTAGEAAQVSSLTRATGAAVGALGRGVSALAKTPTAAKAAKAVSDLYTKAPPVVQKTVEAASLPLSKITEIKQQYPNTAKALEAFSPRPGQVAEDLIATSLQEYSRTGNADEAVKSGLIGTGVGQAMNVLGRAFKAYEGPLKTKLAHKAIPMDYSIEHKDKMVARLIETGSVFSRKGVEAIGKRADDISKAMKEAGKNADDWLREAAERKETGMIVDKSGDIPSFKNISEGGGIISIDEKLNDAFSSMMSEDYYTSTSAGRKKAAWLFQELKKNLPHEMVEIEIVPHKMYGEGKKIQQAVAKDLSFEQAKDIKENYHKKLEKIYADAKSIHGIPIDAQKDLEIKKMFADVIRAGEQEAFDKLQKIASGIEIPPGASIPPPILSTKPWELTIPGKKGTVSYKEAGQTAMIDYDLNKVGNQHVYANYPQYKKESPQQAMQNIAISQFAKGNFGTPSQIGATGWYQVGPEGKTRLVKWIDSLSTKKPPLTSSGRAQLAAGLTRKKEPVLTPSAQSLLEEEKVETVPTSSREYFNRKF